MVQAVSTNPKTSSHATISGPADKSVSSPQFNTSANTNQDRIKEISRNPSKNKNDEKPKNVFSRLWDWLKSFFSSKQKVAEIKERSAPEIVNIKPHSKTFDRVEIYDGLVTIEDMNNLSENYVVLLGDNAEGNGGLFGQSSVLRPAEELYPDSVAGIPVTAKPVTSYDINEVKETSFKENNIDEVNANLALIESAIDETINKAEQQNKSILVLRGGYGTGFSRMPSIAPLTFRGMVELFQKKLGIVYKLDPVNGRYTLQKVAERQNPVTETSSAGLQINLMQDPWVLMNHGVPQAA